MFRNELELRPRQRRRRRQRRQQEEEIPMNNDGEDRISGLSDVILSHIIKKLPLKDMVVTGALAHRWRYVWSSQSIWKLDIASFRRMKKKKAHFKAFVDRVIYLHSGPGINSLHLRYLDPNCGQRMSCWLTFLVRNNIQELDLQLPNEVKPPLCVYTCSSLRALKLTVWHGNGLALPQAVSLPGLKHLHLAKVRFTDEELFGKLIAGCHSLRVLILEECAFNGHRFTRLAISTGTLQILHIRKCAGLNVAMIDLWAPNLHCFRFEGFGLIHRDHHLIRPPIVSDVLLDLTELPSQYVIEKYQRRSVQCAHRVYVLMVALYNACSIALRGWCVQYISRAPHMLERLPTPRERTQLLDMELWPTRAHISVVACFVKIYPMLKKLKLNFVMPPNLDAVNNVGMGYLEPENLMSWENTHSHLKHIEITYLMGTKEELELVKYLLRIAIKLQQIAIRISRDADFLHEIMAYPRATSNLKVTFF